MIKAAALDLSPGRRVPKLIGSGSILAGNESAADSGGFVETFIILEARNANVARSNATPQSGHALL